MDLMFWCSRCGMYRVASRGEACCLCRVMCNRESGAMLHGEVWEKQKRTYMRVMKEYESDGATARAATARDRWPFKAA